MSDFISPEGGEPYIDPFEDRDGDATEAAISSGFATPAPPAPIGSVSLRGYQETAVNNLVALDAEGVGGALCLSATGTGKSVMLAELANRYQSAGHGVLMLVHRDELIRQLVKSCGRMGMPVAVEKAQERALPAFRSGFSKVVCASVQTLRGDRLAAWQPDSFGLIIVDECHHVISRSYTDILKYFGWQKEGAPFIAGFTATADRLDKRNIGSVFDGGLAFEYNLRSAVQDGYLVPLKAVPLETDPPIDLRDLRTSGSKDFSAAELEEIITASLNSIVNAIADAQVLGQRRAIAFTPDVASSQMLADALTKVGISADWVAGDSKDRAQKLAGHQRGDFQVLCNCMLAVEGYDDPAISAIILCRPTKSRGLYSQMVGRGTRLYEGKTDCLIIDFNWLTTNMDLVKAVDLYDDGSVPDEVMEIARELEDEEPRDLAEVLEEAEWIHRARVKERIRRQKIPVKAGMFDPLGLCTFFDIPTQKQGYDWQNVRVASTKLVEGLRKWRIDVPDDIPHAVAMKLMNTVTERHNRGWASMSQINSLVEAGVDSQIARGMRREEASKYLEANPLPPSDPQKYLLKRNGYTDSDLSAMTRKQASELISQIKGK